MSLEEKIKNLPNSSGIYQYFDKNEKLLYIGKAKNLKKRVKSYFSFTPSLLPSSRLSNRISIMINESVDLHYIVTPSEHDALILENSLIKQMKPKYNILLRDDKTYPYIYIDLDEQFPRFEITRKVVRGKGIKYFGPFSSGSRELLNAIYELYPLVQKKGCLKYKKACLYFQIKKCLAPCIELVTPKEYEKVIKKVIAAIANRKIIQKELEIKMLDLASRELFEEASKLRDNINKIKSLSLTSSIDLATSSSYDLFYIEVFNTSAILIKLFIRDGRVSSSSHSSFKSSAGFDMDELYSRAFSEYYSKEIPIIPNEILVGYDFEDKSIMQDFLQDRFNKKVVISTPKKGDKLKLLNVASLNAKEMLRNEKENTVVEEITDLLELDSIPYEIECYDTSHMGGVANVGSLVFHNENSFEKSRYRHYNLEASDEYGQMNELLSNRVKDLEKNPLPDMWLLDGGKAQLNLAREIIQSVGANLDIVAISKEKVNARANRSKGGANDILYTSTKKLKLSQSDKRLQYLQRIRDEAHRFAITFHRKKKLKNDKQISLLEIKGIGKAKVTKLLNYFGSFENIKKSELQELEKVLDKNSAKSVWEFFKGQ